MKPFFLIAFAIVSIALSNCNTERSMVSFNNNKNPGRYNGSQKPTGRYLITGTIKDELNSRPVSLVAVEIYTDPGMTAPLMSVVTGARGMFRFSVPEGFYVIVISHQTFRETKLSVPVGKNDVEMNEILISRSFD